MNVLALCAGIGGIELGLKLACPSARTVCYVEREAFPAALLVQRMEEGHLDPAPVWSDLKTFDAGRWRGVVDLVTGGYPCQPFSVAGKRRGEDDPRHLWPDVARIVAECEPSLVFFENVQGHLSRGFDVVLSTLDALGFDAEWGVFSAAGSGAPQVRKRIFILGAHRGRPVPDTGRLRANWVQPGRQQRPCGSEAANAGATREDLADPPSARLTRTREGGRTAWPPSPEGDWAGVPEALHPALCDVCGVASGIPNRVDRLRALGNAVVPAVAARALTVLWERMNA